MRQRRSQGLSHVSRRLGIIFPTEIAIGVGNATAVACANGTVKSARQDWVSSMRNNKLRGPWKRGTPESEAGLLTAIHEHDQGERPHDRCMVPQSVLTGQPGGVCFIILSNMGGL